MSGLDVMKEMTEGEEKEMQFHKVWTWEDIWSAVLLCVWYRGHSSEKCVNSCSMVLCLISVKKKDVECHTDLRATVVADTVAQALDFYSLCVHVNT